MGRKYKKLDLYKKIEKLVLLIYRLSKKFPKEELFGLVSQMRRAIISVGSNFVEGYGRRTVKDKMHFYNTSLASLNELDFQVGISYKLSYLTKEEYNEVIELINDIIKLLNGYMRGIRNNRKKANKRSTDSGLQSTDSLRESGQTLIETIMAIFILATGLSSGLALAIYSFGASSDITEQISATSLAREGIEVVRQMRDTNWLTDSLVDCDELSVPNRKCYRNWLDETYDITGSGAGRDYRLIFNPSASDGRWSLDTGSDYRLYEQGTGALNHNSGGETTNLFRKLTVIYSDTSAPFHPSHPKVLVRSAVWWHGRNCPAITDLENPSETNCKVITEEFLTNWKNY